MTNDQPSLFPLLALGYSLLPIVQMRLDLFLKKSRLVKQRAWAKELCDDGRVRVNNLPAKASKELKAGDTLTIEGRQKRLTVKILALPLANLPKAKAQESYQILKEEFFEEQLSGRDIWDQ